MYKWAKGSLFNMAVTLHGNSITLNSSAATNFSDVRWVMLGLDKANKKFAVKPIAKNEIDIKAIPLDKLHKISVGKGYARICNKGIMDEIASLLGKKLDNLKLSAIYDENDEMLIIDLCKKMEEVL